jgi:DNA-binding NarL/FixJ family response regulator
LTVPKRSAIIAEDHPLVSEIIEDILAAIIPGVTVFRAADCQELAKYSRVKDMRFGVFDICLPGGSVFSAITRYKEHSPDFRAVILTGSLEKYVLIRGIQAGVAHIGSSGDKSSHS